MYLENLVVSILKQKEGGGGVIKPSIRTDKSLWVENLAGETEEATIVNNAKNLNQITKKLSGR